MTIDEAATRVGRTPRTIRQWIADETLPVAATLRPQGRLVRYVAEDALLEAERVRGRRGRPPAGKRPPLWHQGRIAGLTEALALLEPGTEAFDIVRDALYDAESELSA